MPETLKNLENQDGDVKELEKPLEKVTNHEVKENQLPGRIEEARKELETMAKELAAPLKNANVSFENTKGGPQAEGLQNDNGSAEDSSEENIETVRDQERIKEKGGSPGKKGPGWFSRLLKGTFIAGAISVPALGYGESANAQGKESQPAKSQKAEKTETKGSEEKLLEAIDKNYRAALEDYKKGFEKRIDAIRSAFNKKKSSPQQQIAFEEEVNRQREFFLKEADLAQSYFDLAMEQARAERDQSRKRSPYSKSSRTARIHEYIS